MVQWSLARLTRNKLVIGGGMSLNEPYQRLSLFPSARKFILLSLLSTGWFQEQFVHKFKYKENCFFHNQTEINKYKLTLKHNTVFLNVKDYVKMFTIAFQQD